jgi:hypothetical protein
MKTSKLVLVVAAITLLCFIAWSSQGQGSSRRTWEYKVITVYGTAGTPPPNLTQFNDMGSQGWELVTVLSESVSEKRQIKVEYYFKRIN